MSQAVVKIGGGALGAADTLFSDLAVLQRKGAELIVVHGGGNVVSDWQRRQGLEARFEQGLRVTDASALEVATAVLAGLINKFIVASITRCGGRAVGVSGVDGGIIQAETGDSGLGYVGQVTKIDPSALKALVSNGYLPILSPIAAQIPPKWTSPLIPVLEYTSPPDSPEYAEEMQVEDTYKDWKGLLNVNADTVAGALAATIHASTLIFLTDVDGIRDETGTSVPTLSDSKVQALIETGVITSGMIPKVKACLTAAESSVNAVITDGRRPHALLDAVEGRGPGTWFGVN